MSTLKRAGGRRAAHARAVARAEKTIADNLPELVEKMLELARGVKVQAETKDGDPEVYRKPPDRHALEYLMNRVIGKPVEKREVKGDGQLPLDIEIKFGE